MSKLHGSKFMPVLLAVLLAAAAVLPGTKAYAAATRLDPEHPCSITVTTPEDMPALKEKDFDVSIWRVATVNENGEYALTAAFDELEFLGYTLKGSSISKEHNDIISGKTRDFSYACYERVLSNSVSADTVIKVHEGTGSAGIQPGYYLIVPGDITVTVGDDIYRFDPVLVTLPHVEAAPSSEEAAPGVEDWVYDITVSLKPETDSIRGNVKIVKNLTGYNETLEGADFVFTVRATKNGRIVYSNVISLHFRKDDCADGKKSKEYIVKDLPIGSLVEVEEVYSGSVYKLDSWSADPADRLVIAADEEEDGQQVLTFTFNNSPDNHTSYGTSVLNFYTNSRDDSDYYPANPPFIDSNGERYQPQ